MTKNIRRSHSVVHHLLPPAIHNSQFIIIDDLRASVVSCGAGYWHWPAALAMARGDGDGKKAMAMALAVVVLIATPLV
ncbi:MAG TPA: hypothetical protein VL093_06990 [Flavipsychrobacter sp.]|nr:hypothetical protein [Flavipsychrobacter sp.]